MNAHEKVDIIISNFHRRIFEIYGRKQREVALVIAEYLRSKEKEIAGIIEKYEKEEIDAQRLKADLLLLITRNKTYSTLVEQSADDITAATVEIFELMPKYEKEAFEVSYEEERLAAEQDYTGIMMLSVAAVLGGFAFRNTLNRSKESRFVKRNLKSAFTSRILTFGGEYTSPYKFNTSITRSVKEKAYKAT